MSDYIHDLKVQQVNTFISNFDNLEEVSVSEIKKGLKNILGEEPGVEFEYEVNRSLNENGDFERDSLGRLKKDEKLKKIKVFFTYISETHEPKFDGLTFIVN